MSAKTSREELRSLMHDMGISVRGLARACGLSAAYVSDVLLGRRRGTTVTSHLRSVLGPAYERRSGAERRQPGHGAGPSYDRRGGR